MKIQETLRSKNVSIVNLFWPYFTLKFNMPKKSKKAKFKPHKVQVNQYGEIFSNSGAVNGTSPIATLNYFFEIFSDRVEKDVIKLVLDECDFNVDQASETLMSLCNDDARIQSQYDERDSELTISEYGLPYHNNFAYSDVGVFNTDEFSNVPSKSQSLTNISSKYLNDATSTNTQNNIFKNSDDANSVNNSWNGYAAWDETSYEKISSSTTCSHHSMNNTKETEAIASSNLNPDAPSFIVPMVPMHGSPCPHKSPGFEANRVFWNAPDSRYFSSSASNNHCKKKDNHQVIKEVSEKIQCGCRVLVILRGLPGSGKSTLALKLKFSGVIYSTDDFFMRRRKYKFDPSRLSEAHEWNKLRTKIALQKGITPVIIDNTNTEAWEMKPYILMGKKYNYEIVILEPDTPWKFNVNLLALRNKHGVPRSKIAHMKERYEHNITVDKILATNAFLSPDLKNIKPEITNEDNCIIEGNHVSLKAIIHTEDNSSDEKSPILTINNLKLTDDKSKDSNSISKTKEENILLAELDWNSSTDCQTSTICDLEELRALTKNDSEDSQSCCNSTNSSSQEVTGWEAITERDNDFQWSASPNDLNSIWKSKSLDNLHLKESTESSSAEDVISISHSSSENIFNSIENKSVAVKFECYSEPLLTASDLHKRETHLENSQKADESKISPLCNSKNFDQYVESNGFDFNIDRNINESVFSDYSQVKLWSSNENTTELSNQLNTVDLDNNDNVSFKSSSESLIIHEEVISDTDNINQNLNFMPKPQRNYSTELLKISKDYFSNQLTVDKSESMQDVDNSNTIYLDWSSVDNNENELNVENNSEMIYNVEIPSTPKPQRELKNSLYFGEDKNTDGVTYPSKKKSLLNISADSVGEVWTFPELIIDSPPHQVNPEKKTLCFKMSTSCQTEPRDFDYLYKVSSGNNNINLIGNNIITAKNFNNVSEKYCDIKLNEDSDSHCFNGFLFDKSTSTDDMVDDIEISQKLAHLQSCFPDISNEDLLHLLEICCNDERWISNLLLDWGYKYNVPTEYSNEENKEANNQKSRYTVNSEVYEDGVDFSIWKSNALSKSSTSSSLDTDSSSKNSEESKEVHPVEEVEENNIKFQLVLDSSFAHQLEQLFGALPNSGNRIVDVDYEFAKLIYKKWKSTVPSPSEENNIKIDEKLNKSKDKKFKHNKKSNKTTPIRNVSLNKSEDSSFSEIMDMEFARQLHIEKLKIDDDFRTKMKRSELYNMFPGADTIVLDEIFESNNYSLEDSLRILGADITKQETIEKKRNVEKFDARIKEWEKTNIFQEFENGDWSDWIYKDDNASLAQEITVPVLSTTISAEAAALRNEAAEHYQLRQEFIQKAQAAYCRGMRDVASFYAQQGTEEGRIAKDTNKLAAALIAQERNSSNPIFKIDLHGLHIQEAISLLEKFLLDKKLEIRRRQYPTPVVITIITGQGIHSAQGAKLRPAVMSYLKSYKYNFSEIKAGQLEVTLMSE